MKRATTVMLGAMLVCGCTDRGADGAPTESAATSATAAGPAAATIAATSPSAASPAAQATQPEPGSTPVTADNFGRAATDVAFGTIVQQGGLGKFHHNRELTPLDNQVVVRQNRDTLYSSAVFDLDAGPVTITLPDTGDRFMSMQVFDEDQYTHLVAYKPGKYTLTRQDIGTRYAMAALRMLVDPNAKDDVGKVHALQDAVVVEQPGGPGAFDVPKWDKASLGRITDALTVLGDTLPDKNRMFGTKAEVEPVRRLIGVGTAWGGNPEKDATYLNFTPQRNDGNTVHRLVVKDVPVDGFWSVTVYDAKGFFQQNAQNAYSFNNITAKKGDDGSVTIQFGGCDGNVPNCLPITPGWNYLVRLYRPRAEVLSGGWKFPEAEPVG
ncbi:DUF1254 domain-containing protein [Lysobacter sp. A6]|uniref:DUF1254 domain-containing protein n=1 Tax=Noviluteimonas lactosilytica TaxID=2888523 RepID=A0ABS8JIB9_9GAMM|nr:DUF1254 domain-containing protein [Lysobacter lactosilyticus]MCC8363348.1 DUF1254 domain-containing protein [Lysobacter lactosilyticus]